MPTDLDDILEEHRDLVQETDDDPDLVKHLRGELRKTSKRAKGYETLEQENRTLKSERLITTAGLTDLDDVQKETLSEWAAKQQEVTADSIRERAVALKWAEPVADPAEKEVAEQQRIAAAARGATSGSSSEITPEQMAQWDQPRIRQFIKQHPNEFERLKKGETATGLTSF